MSQNSFPKESLSQQIKTLNQRNLEMQAMRNRINQLQQLQKVYESTNHVIQSKMERILEIKKHNMIDQVELEKKRYEVSLENKGQHNNIREMRKKQLEDNKQIKQDMEEMRKLRSKLSKEQLQMKQSQIDAYKEQELQDRQQQCQKISEWEYNLKFELEDRKMEKLFQIRQQQNELKTTLAQRVNESSSVYEQMQLEEQRLLNKLKETQAKRSNLQNELVAAMNISVKEYNSISGVLLPNKSSSTVKLTPKQLESPYAQVPAILKYRIGKGMMSGQLNQQSFREQVLKEYQYSLPSLSKPTYEEQQKHIERLVGSKQIQKPDFFKSLEIDSVSKKHNSQDSKITTISNQKKIAPIEQQPKQVQAKSEEKKPEQKKSIKNEEPKLIQQEPPQPKEQEKQKVPDPQPQEDEEENYGEDPDLEEDPEQEEDHQEEQPETPQKQDEPQEKNEEPNQDEQQEEEYQQDEEEYQPEVFEED